LALGGVLVVCVLSYFLFFGSWGGISDLRVGRNTLADNIIITNIGQSPITIQSASLNGKEVKERKYPRDLKDTEILNFFNDTSKCAVGETPTTLQIGQSIGFGLMTICGEIIEAIIHTDHGTGTYRWK
jgi:hypothetical protein